VVCHFDEYFDQQIRGLEKTSLTQDVRFADSSAFLEEAPRALSGNLGDEPPPLPGFLSRGQSKINHRDLTSNESTPIATPDTSRPTTPAGHILTGKGGPGGKGSRRTRKAANAPTAYASSGDELYAKKPRALKAGGLKKGRKWDADGLADEDSDTPLDYSVHANDATSGEDEGKERPGAMEKVDQGSWGSKTGKGQFVLKDLDDKVNTILASADAKKGDFATASTGIVGSSISALGGLFRNVVGGKTLTKEDLDKAMKGMEDHLLRKNVAREAAIRLCEGVERELIGVKTGNFESMFYLHVYLTWQLTLYLGVQAKIQTAMESSLQKILTPTSSLDLLREIDAVASPSSISLQKKRPYVISIVGVNGVGKSTNLSKICFFLLQNKYKVLVVACDTFRSGAVEQLAVHVRNLKELTSREGGEVELYQKGYGKDAANVAKDAVTFAVQEGFDVVLIDTAGRRHNDQRLMSSLEKFAKFANPDKILMVGEVSLLKFAANGFY
jgi:signal recognition particle receptor subunit alpha